MRLPRPRATGTQRLQFRLYVSTRRTWYQLVHLEDAARRVDEIAHAEHQRGRSGFSVALVDDQTHRLVIAYRCEHHRR
jgi:hypothetical protein